MTDKYDVCFLFSQKTGTKIYSGIPLLFYEDLQFDFRVALYAFYCLFFLSYFLFGYLLLFGFSKIFLLLIIIEVMTRRLFLDIIQLCLIECKSYRIVFIFYFFNPSMVLLLKANLPREDVVSDISVKISQKLKIGGDLLLTPFLVYGFIQNS